MSIRATHFLLPAALAISSCVIGSVPLGSATRSRPGDTPTPAGLMATASVPSTRPPASETATSIVLATPTDKSFDFSELADQWLTYRNDTYGFSFEYPAVYAEGPYSFCDLREISSQDSVTITVGMRSELYVSDTQGQTIEEYVDARIAALQSGDPNWELESREATTQAGVDAISIDYRFGGLSRIGSALIFKRGSDLYVFNFTFGAFCDVPEIGLYEWDVYPRMISSFKWLDE